MSYKLSNKAEQDLRRIYQYTLLNFGDQQAASYLIGLEETLEQVANTPAVVRALHQHR